MSSQRYVSDALKRKKQKVKKIKFYAISLLTILCLAGIVYVIQMPFMRINDVKISGNTFVDTEEINSKTNELLNRNTYWIFPNKNIFLFSKKALEAKIKENPAVIKVLIKKDFFNTLIINIEEQEKEMLYCTSVEKTECFYINKVGFIYAKVEEYIIPEQEVIIYNEQEKKNIKDTVLDEATYAELVLFIKNITRQDIKIGEVYIKEGGIIEFVSQSGVRIITSRFDDFEKDFDNFMALFDQNILTKEKLSEIEYMDLRFGNKVFYKNKTN